MVELTRRSNRALPSGRRVFWIWRPVFCIFAAICSTNVAFGLGPMATKIVAHVTKQQLSWERDGSTSPCGGGEATVPRADHWKSGKPINLGEIALSAKKFASSEPGRWTRGFHFWNVPKETKAVEASTVAVVQALRPTSTRALETCLNYLKCFSMSMAPLLQAHLVSRHPRVLRASPV